MKEESNGGLALLNTLLKRSNGKITVLVCRIQHIPRSQKIRSTLYTEYALRKLLCKLKDRVVTEDKNSNTYDADCSKCEAVYFGSFKRSLETPSDERIRSVKNCHCHSPQGNLKKILRGILITLTTFPICFLNYGFLIYGSFYLFIYVTLVGSN